MSTCTLTLYRIMTQWSVLKSWFSKKKWTPLPFQEAAWKAYSEGKNGLVNAPTGSGKTYSLLLPAIVQHSQQDQQSKGPIIIWITPIRALAKEIGQAAERALEGLDTPWRVGIRTGDTTTTQRKKQWADSPEILITTPESLHILLSTQGYPKYFQRLELLVADEWHELVGSKRGVQVELALSRLRALRPSLRVWGISATIGNLEESMNILLGKKAAAEGVMIKSSIEKEITVTSLYPETLDKFPWAGHLGIKLMEEIIPIVEKSKSTLIFTNTRGQCEIWYQNILEAHPEYAGVMAMHHGSISREIRDWVENALYDGKLKAVVCTSSLDLGVDFRPVESIIQIGGPKGVARFMQRAGRSGHSPNATSNIYFVPTHAMEFIEAAALRESSEKKIVEQRMPYIRCFDVLVQYLMTLACSEGFEAKQIWEEIKATHCYEHITKEEWQWVLSFLQFGGPSLRAYDEYQRLGKVGDSFRILNKRIAQRHKMSIGTIVSEVMISVKFSSGKRVGQVEEFFISQFKPGDHFWFAGRSLQLVRVKDMTAIVKKSNKKSGNIPSYLGGRLSYSSEMSDMLKKKIYAYAGGEVDSPEMEFLAPLLDFQQERSYLPAENEIMVEYFQTKEGYHLILYPFEGRHVHEALGALLAMRIAQQLPITFSIAMNDYGVELLSDQEIDVHKYIVPEIFTTKKLYEDIQSSVNAIEMSRRRFRDIAKISGLIFEGFPGQKKKERHLQNSSQLLFDVFREYEPDNLLYLQAIEETMTFQFEEARLRRVLQHLQTQKIVICTPDKPTPFSFPILVDRLRETLTSEKLEDRIKKMTLEYEE